MTGRSIFRLFLIIAAGVGAVLALDYFGCLTFMGIQMHFLTAGIAFFLIGRYVVIGSGLIRGVLFIIGGLIAFFAIGQAYPIQMATNGMSMFLGLFGVRIDPFILTCVTSALVVLVLWIILFFIRSIMIVALVVAIFVGAGYAWYYVQQNPGSPYQ